MLFQELFDSTKTAVTLIGPEDFPEILIEGVKSPVIYVDGGVRHRSKVPASAGRGIAIGDGDSTEVQMDLLLPKVKDFSDFSYVLKNIPPHYKQVRTLGFLGGRRDHEILNLGEAHHFLKLRDRCQVIFDHEVWGFSAGSWSLYLDGAFSLVNLEAADLKLTGLSEFQIIEEKKVRPLTSLGLSNVGRGEVTITSSQPFFIYPEKTLRLAENG